jgi:hypothetical protein
MGAGIYYRLSYCIIPGQKVEGQNSIKEQEELNSFL